MAALPLMKLQVVGSILETDTGGEGRGERGAGRPTQYPKGWCSNHYLSVPAILLDKMHLPNENSTFQF